MGYTGRITINGKEIFSEWKGDLTRSCMEYPQAYVMQYPCRVKKEVVEDAINELKLASDHDAKVYEALVWAGEHCEEELYVTYCNKTLTFADKSKEVKRTVKCENFFIATCLFEPNGVDKFSISVCFSDKPSLKKFIESFELMDDKLRSRRIESVIVDAYEHTSDNEKLTFNIGGSY